MMNIPKGFMTAIRVPFGPAEGTLAMPCICGQPTDLEGERVIHLVQWKDGRVMFCHEECVGTPDA